MYLSESNSHWQSITEEANRASRFKAKKVIVDQMTIDEKIGCYHEWMFLDEAPAIDRLNIPWKYNYNQLINAKGCKKLVVVTV